MDDKTLFGLFTGVSPDPTPTTRQPEPTTEVTEAEAIKEWLSVDNDALFGEEW